MPSLSFKGKAFVQHHHLVVPFHELTPIKTKGTSKTASLHDNVIVHGDNLRALKALLPTHAGKVKCIYIDPPYNTGNEGWAYNDNVSSPMLQEWLGQTVDREDLTRHDKWCCMMMPRLRLLREFLTDDGAIFVSIDDNEVHRLRCLMDEVFGEDNFVADAVWRSADSSNNDSKAFSLDHNHTVIYSRESGWIPKVLARSEGDNAHYKNPDHDPRGPWFSGNLSSPQPRKNLQYTLTSPAGHTIDPPGNGWRWKRETMEEMIETGEVVFTPDGKKILKKTYLADQHGLAPSTLWDDIEETGHNRNAKYELKKLFPELATAALFGTPKPSKFITKILQIATDKDSIVMDSFAGSGTTAHAVLALNRADGGNRRFVLVEGEDYADTITAERVRRVIKGVPTAKDETLNAGLGGSFSYFKLGQPLSLHSILEGKDLPARETLASYLFFTATGEEFDPKAAKRKEHFIGTSRLYDVFLLYTEDPEKLKGLALTLDVANALRGPGGKQKLVFAPTKYLDEHFLDRMRITFQQLPFQIYQALDK
ncbi:MAG: site-specific DNA-methyltransferase [Lacunisphaera sp.]|jgi:adenine-specific DNA-methyltransferase|nr:site-specific DNA-methyltransferase [Lacunisphaera sp.]